MVNFSGITKTFFISPKSAFKSTLSSVYNTVPAIEYFRILVISWFIVSNVSSISDIFFKEIASKFSILSDLIQETKASILCKGVFKS